MMNETQGYLRTASHGVGVLDPVAEPVALWRNVSNNTVKIYRFRSRIDVSVKRIN